MPTSTTADQSASPLRVWTERDGAVPRLRLARPKANLIDMAMADALDRALAAHAEDAALRAVLLDHEGPHFSYGASIPEHLPEHCAAMLRGMHALILRMVDFPLPILSAIGGYCLGGGLEVAAAGHLLFAAPDAKLGQPEIKLGVFAPSASCLLPERLRQADADDLLMSGRMIDADRAREIGLIFRIAADPAAAALAYVDEHLAPLSGASLRCAVRASRFGLTERIRDKLARVETYYLADLMRLSDPIEGLTAFLAKRPPQWRNR